jgi:hypothetical protein
MKRIGAALLVLGALVGVTAGLWVMIGLETLTLPWLVSVGLVKLIIVASLGIMGAGAVMTRIAKKAEQRSRANLGSGLD